MTGTSWITWLRRSLRRQPVGVRDFLLQTSILERLNGPLCDAVSERDDGRTMLESLERGNLFVVPLDSRAALVPLPPSFRRCAPRAPGGGISRSAGSAPPARVGVVRAELALRPTRSATRLPPGISSGRRTWSSWRDGNAPEPAGGDPARLARSCPTKYSAVRPVLSADLCRDFAVDRLFEGVEALLPGCRAVAGWPRAMVDDRTRPRPGWSLSTMDEFRRLPALIAVHRAGFRPGPWRSDGADALCPAGAGSA